MGVGIRKCGMEHGGEIGVFSSLEDGNGWLGGLLRHYASSTILRKRLAAERYSRFCNC